MGSWLSCVFNVIDTTVINMWETGITPVHHFGYFLAKREDLACWTSIEMPSGSKVRQYQTMAAKTPGAPMIVGCASHSAMQIYVAASAHQSKVPGIVYVPKRSKPTPATEYAKRYGASIHEIKPGYMSVLRAKAREHAKKLGQTVRWDPKLAIDDTVDQCKALHQWTNVFKRIVVPTGSGLTAAGILAWTSLHYPQCEVLVVAVSPLADEIKIKLLASKTSGLPVAWLSPLQLVRCSSPYGKAFYAKLPDETPLDPYYAAKAVPYLTRTDLLWIPGLRPVSAMPADNPFSWRGFIR